MKKINLASIDLESLKLRVIYVIRHEFVSTTPMNCSSECIPLYLGADVLKSSRVRTENLPRVHSNYAKDGLATKLRIDNVSINGIHGTANGVWFYSIQGLFKATFDLLSRDQQKVILTHLKDIWLAREHDASLPMSLDVQLADCGSMTDSLQSATIPADQIDSNPDNNNKMERGNKYPNDLTSSINALKRYTCSKLNCSMNDVVVTTLEKILFAILVLFTERKWQAIPWGIILDYTDIVLNKNGSKSALLLYCEWIGEVFYNMQPDINMIVNEFKARHIHCIDDLPPAEEIINIFPIEMTKLLQSWMYLNPNDTNQAKLPILQLVLEILNQSLITGVSHVVYSKLVEQRDCREN